MAYPNRIIPEDDLLYIYPAVSSTANLLIAKYYKINQNKRSA